MKILYQIENGKSGRRVIWENYGKWKWSEGNGEDGTFFDLDQLKFVLKSTEIEKNMYDSGGDCFLVYYEIQKFGSLDDLGIESI